MSSRAAAQAVVATYDVVVVGAGLVGLAVARAASLAGLETLLVEAHDAIGQETSSRNSEGGRVPLPQKNKL